MPKAASSSDTQTFKARLERLWIDLPDRVSRAFGAGKVPIVFTAGHSAPRKTTLTPRAGGGHRMWVHGEVRREIGAKDQDLLTFRIWRDVEPRAVPLSEDLADALRDDGVLEVFQTMGPAMQRELVAFVEKAKYEETRMRRIARVVERANEEREKRVDREAKREARKAAKGDG